MRETIICVRYWRNTPAHASGNFVNECTAYVLASDLGEVIKMLDAHPECRMLSNHDIRVVGPSLIRQICDIPYQK